MAEFSLDRFKYRWRGNWSSATSYRRDDIVRVNGKSYVCLVAHTSDSAFRTDLNAILPGSNPPQPQPKWTVMTSGRSFLGAWSTGIDYNLGDIVLYNGSLYLCTSSHASTSFVTNYTNWTLFALHIDYVGNWATATDYAPGAVVKYNGYVYECITAHNSASTLEANQNDWIEFYEGVEYRGSWTTNTEYRKNDRVKYGGTIFVCTLTHTSTALFNKERFDVEFPGFQHEKDWSSSETYQTGDIVKYGGYLYYATDINTNQKPTGSAAAAEEEAPGGGGGSGGGNATSYTVTVEDGGSGNIFAIDGAVTPNLTFIPGRSYIFNQDSATNIGHPLYLSSTQDGKFAGGTVYTTGVTYFLDNVQVSDQAAYAAGFDAASQRELRITVAEDAPETLYYVCENHSGMAGAASITVEITVQYWTVLSKTYNFRASRLIQKTVTVGTDNVNGLTTGVFYVDGVESPKLNFTKGSTYVFDQSDGTNSSFGGNYHPLMFSTISDGRDETGLVHYSTGVVYKLDDVEVTMNDYISGFVAATTRTVQITVNSSAPATLYYFGHNALTQGDSINVLGGSIWNLQTQYRPGDLVLRGGRLYQALKDVDETSKSLTKIVTVGDDTVNGRNAGRFYIDGVEGAALELIRGAKYTFDQSDSSNAIYALAGDPLFHPLMFSETEDGELNNGAHYNIGVVYKLDGTTVTMSQYVTGFQNATIRLIEFTVPLDAPDTLYYWCHFHLGQGGTISIVADTGTDIDTTDWELLLPGTVFSQQWQSSQRYSVGQVVNYFGSAYVCNIEHISSNLNFPGDNGNTYQFWDILIQAGQPGGMLQIGDLLSFGLNRENVGDGSSEGSLRIPIGTRNQKLSVSEELEVFWREVTNDADTIYVSNNGNDITGNGTQYSPFKTIRHACEYIEDNVSALTPTKVAVATGRYEENCPIIVPAGTVVMGDELRSTTIIANGPKTEYAGHYTYVEAYLSYFLTFLNDLITNQDVAGGYTGGTGQNKTLASSNLDGTNATGALITDYKNTIEARLISGGNNPTVTGSNTLNTNQNIANAGPILQANRLFIYNEIIGYLEATYPTITFNTDNIKADVYSLIRALNRDLTYTGNYLTTLAGRRFASQVLGSQIDDMFYLRDTTGLRNCTVDGLAGGLNPPGVFAQFQRPTGGAYCSLDPGWGPADERTWIANRSPYIQGVTTLGYAAIGQKIDGNLHNGGNKSMVSNDFTQVISDGIGAWVLNNARAELVSVFTYYAQVGYLAEDGGIIRATNGNNSYGQFGSIAEGNDPTETPQSVSVWNRNNEAQVVEAFAGGINDRIFALEYSHCGETYTNATAEIEGAGADASVTFTDFRDGALYNARLINTSGSGTEGGSNYLLRQNSAQITSAAQNRIILNTNEPTQFLSEILGMRILIVSGDGTGQYGIINGYDQPTKVCDVIKESDGTPGWDHIIPGTPIEAALDSTAVYRIEPRVVANHPGFNTTLRNLPSNRTYSDATFGGVTETFTGVDLAIGTGETFDADAIQAEVTVVQNSRNYTVTLTNPGAGYAVNDQLTILGTSLGGASPANDLILTVTSVSDDSTNSILTFTQSGIGREGRIIAIAEPNYAQRSDDGINWSETNLPFNGPFRKVISGNGKFVVVPESGNTVAWSETGTTWITRSLPTNETWIDGTFGEGRFVILAQSNTANSVVYSDDGLSWSSASLPAGSDSTVDEYQAIAHGAGKFVAITGSQTGDVAVSDNGVTWTLNTGVLPTGYQWAAMAYGNNRFLAIATDGSTAYSLDHGTTWYTGTRAPDGVGESNPDTVLTFQDIKYSQGVFLCTVEDSQGSTVYVATTEDGLYWYQRALGNAGINKITTFTNFSNVGKWHVFANDATTGGLNEIATGAQARVRADIFQGKFQNIKIWDPGSGYDSASNPITLTVTDNQFVSEVETDNRIGYGVLSQPTFVNRGTGYRTSTSTITITGDGYADIIPEAQEVTLKGVSVVPGPGAQIRFSTILDPATADPNDTLLFTGVGVTDLGEDDSGTGTRLVKFKVSPSLKNEYNLAHGTTGTVRTRFSQCRISGHDFLDIGTGNFVQTNYPALYAGGAFFVAAPENEVLEVDGGRVFYTSTDQDGNFRAGELFSVDQATGIVTISAEFFDLDGLSELALGGVRLGGSGTVVNEFSTDATFAADSNNIIPTQRAIATFLSDRLSVGGSDLEAGGIQAGSTLVGTNENVIDNVINGYVNFPTDVEFFTRDDNGNVTNIQGTIISQMLYFRNFNDTIQ